MMTPVFARARNGWVSLALLALFPLWASGGTFGSERRPEDQAELTASRVPWVSFTRAHGLASDSVLVLQPMPNRYLWVGTNAGLSILSPTNEWLTLTSGNGLAGDIITDLASNPQTPRQQWIATTEGATLLDDRGYPHNPEQHTTISYSLADGLVDSSISAVAVDRAGGVWLGTARLNDQGEESGSGISVLRPGQKPFDKADDSWRHYTAADGSLVNNVVHDIVVDGRGAVWVATLGGLDVFSADERTSYTTADGLPSNNVRAILASGELLWLATDYGLAVMRGGATPHTKTDDQWALFYTGNSGLASNATKSLARDAAGRIWISTNWLDQGGDYGAGISVLSHAGTPFDPADDGWTRFTTSQGLLNNAVRSVGLVGGLVFMGTRSGLSRLDIAGTIADYEDDRWVSYSERNRIAGFQVSAIAPAGRDRVWLGTDEGLSLLDHKGTVDQRRDDSWVTLTDQNSLPDNGIRALAADQRGWLWVGTGAGLSVRDLAGTPSDPADDVVLYIGAGAGQLASAQINDIAIDSAGRAWVACGSYFDGALHVIALGPSLADRSDDRLATFGEAEGLPDPYVRSLALQGQEVWLATDAGGARLNHAGTPFEPGDDSWASFTAANSGIGQDLVRDVAVDGAGNVWFALAIGGVSARGPGGRWARFTQSDGLISNTTRAVLADRRGRIWIGTSGGVSQLSTGGTLFNKGDDGWTNASAATLPYDGANSFALDEAGRVWAGLFGGASVHGPFVRVGLPMLMK